MSSERGQFDLIVNYLPTGLDEKMLESLFSYCGNVVDVRIMKHKSGTTRGFGFVTFATKSEADEAMERYNGFQIGHKRLKVSHAIYQRRDLNMSAFNAQNSISPCSSKSSDETHFQIRRQINSMREKNRQFNAHFNKNTRTGTQDQVI